MIAPLTIYQANLSNQDFSYLFTFHKLFYMNHIYTCERRNCAKLSSDRLSSDESFAFPSSDDCCYVSYLNFMPQCCSVSPFETHSSYGAIVLDHLAAHGTGLTGGQVAVVALLQVHAHLLRCVFTSKNRLFSLLKNAKCKKEAKYEIKRIFGRNHSFTLVRYKGAMNILRMHLNF